MAPLQQDKIPDDPGEQHTKLQLENKCSMDVLWGCCAQGGRNEPKSAAVETGGWIGVGAKAKCWIRLTGKGWKLCQWGLDKVGSGAVQMELILPWGWARPPEDPSKAAFYAL